MVPSLLVLLGAGAEIASRAAGVSTLSTLVAGVGVAGEADVDDEERLKVAPVENWMPPYRPPALLDMVVK